MSFSLLICYNMCLGSSESKESACNEGDLGLIPGLGRAPGERKGYPLQYSGLEMLKLKLQYFGHLMQRTDSLEKTLMLGWEAQTSPRVARESWGWRSSHCRAEETSPKRVSGT